MKYVLEDGLIYAVYDPFDRELICKEGQCHFEEGILVLDMSDDFASVEGVVPDTDCNH